MTATLSVAAVQFSVTVRLQLTEAVRPVGTVGGVVSAGGVVPPSSGVSAGYHRSDIFWKPESSGWTPSVVSATVSKPVNWSTTVTGDWAVVLPAAQAGMALLSAATPGGHHVQPPGVIGMIWATRIFMLGLLARIWSTSVPYAARIVAAGMLFQTSLVPRCMSTMSGLVADSQPGNWFWFAMPVARNPPWPSLSPSWATEQPPPGSVPTKSMSG